MTKNSHNALAVRLQENTLQYDKNMTKNGHNAHVVRLHENTTILYRERKYAAV